MLNKKAAEILKYFTTKTRPDGEVFVLLKDNTPDHIREDFVRECHGMDIFPDDYRYEWIRDCLQSIVDNDLDDEDEIRDSFNEWCEGFIYNNERIKWLGSNLSRASYVDDAQREFGRTDEMGVLDLINQGVVMEQLEVYERTLEKLIELDGE